MNYIFPSTAQERDQIQSNLFILASIFLGLFGVILTLSPSARTGSIIPPFKWLHWVGIGVWLVGFSSVHRLSLKRLEDHDPYILPVVGILSGWGLLTIWRLDPYFAIRQTIWLTLCLGMFSLGLRTHGLLEKLRKYKYIWLFLALGLTILTFFFGVYPGGAGPELWLGCCGIYLQPSEILKVLFLVYLASYLADRLPLHLELLPILLPTMVMGVIALGILISQRDLGTGSLFMLVYFMMLYIASSKRRILVFAGLMLLIAGIVGYANIGLIQNRIDTWMNPWIDTAGKSYQIVQSLIAIANGGIIGRGPGLGNPGLIPIPHSDFIFSSIAEETGLVGTLAILVLFAVLAGRGMIISLNAANPYQRFLAAGIVCSLLIQSIIIIGGNLGILPLTGLTLPFLSYGGSSLTVSFFSALLLLLISSQGDQEPAVLRSVRTYQFASFIFLSALAILGLGNGIWGVLQSRELLSRPENPRFEIADGYVKRGFILDRKNTPLSVSVGTSGSYQRLINYPPMSATLGYSSKIYGQSGIERTMDGYLRGMEGTPSSLVWFHHLLYGQHPPGLDVRLTIDVALQESVEEILENENGAIVLMNAQTGEILASATFPTFNGNLLEENWSEWVESADNPMLNRVTHGLYPIGAASGPILLAKTTETNSMKDFPGQNSINTHGILWDCAVKPESPDWGALVSGGCPGALVELGSQFERNQIEELYKSLGFFEELDIHLDMDKASYPEDFSAEASRIFQITDLQVTPLLMARAIAPLSNQGSLPTPRIVLAVNTPSQGWVTLDSGPSQSPLTSQAADLTAQNLRIPGMPAWHSVAMGMESNNSIAWYLGGSTPEWHGTPYVTVVALESGNAILAKEKGLQIARLMTNPGINE